MTKKEKLKAIMIPTEFGFNEDEIKMTNKLKGILHMDGEIDTNHRGAVLKYCVRFTNDHRDTIKKIESGEYTITPRK